MNRICTALSRVISQVALPTLLFVGSTYIHPILITPVGTGLLTYFWYQRGTNPLHLAVRTGNLRIVERVLSLNPANILTRDHLSGETPLDRAIQNGSTEIAQFLRSQIAVGRLIAPCA